MTLGAPAIWTIGHSTRTIEASIDLLRRYQIEILVDVRHFPGSRRLPHFNRAALHHALATAGIRYEHVIELGGRRPARPDSHNLFWRNASFRGYADYMETQPMTPTFKVGDRVEWNSEAGLVRGTIKKKVTSAIKFKTYTVRASKEEPQYLIKSDTTNHLAMHKGSALKKIRRSKRAGSLSGRSG